MSDQEYVYKCPVCTTELRKISPSIELDLMLDYCDQCGGIWFRSGQVRQLRLCSPDVLGGLITLKKQLYTVECESCGHKMTRNSAECGQCGHVNAIDCPGCGDELERVPSELFTVDVCRSCRGVWFDNIDLSQVWDLQFDGADGFGDPAASSEDEDEDTMDTVVAVLRHRKTDDDDKAEQGSGKAFGTIADIIGGIFPKD